MSERFYRHKLGFTADQVRAARQIRLGRTAARGGYVAFTGLVLLMIAPLPLASLVPESARTWIATALIVCVAIAASVAITLGISRGRLPQEHRFHLQAARTAWLLIPVAIFVLIVAVLVGASAPLLGFLGLAVAAAGVADAALGRAQALGKHTEGRVCVVDLALGTRTWHSESELAALDEAAEIVSKVLNPVAGRDQSRRPKSSGSGDQSRGHNHSGSTELPGDDPGQAGSNGTA